MEDKPKPKDYPLGEDFVVGFDRVLGEPIYASQIFGLRLDEQPDDEESYKPKRRE